MPSYEVGDVVRVIDDMAETHRLQQGHGEWIDDMALVHYLFHMKARQPKGRCHQVSQRYTW